MKRNKLREGFFILLFWISLWWLLSIIANKFYVPSPLETGKVLVTLLSTSLTYKILLSSIIRVLIALSIGIGLGVGLGILAGMNDMVYKTLQPVIIAIKSTPVVSFIILLIILVEDAWVPSLCGILLCFPIIYYNVVEGYKMVDTELISMSTIYKVPFYRKLKKLYLPSTLPYLFAGVLTSIGICWKGTIAAEVIAFINDSVGQQLYDGKVWMDYDHVFAWTFLIIICSLCIEIITKRLIKKVKYYERFKVI